MGKPVGKASGRTFNTMSTCFPSPCWTSLLVTSCIPLKYQTRRLPKPWRAVYPWPVMQLQGKVIHHGGQGTEKSILGRIQISVSALLAPIYRGKHSGNGALLICRHLPANQKQ